jgi:omega-6 fatty acid desaturase (delta-12 desaturase)
MKSGKELTRATARFAQDDPARSWWYVLSTGGLMLAAYGGTLWNFHPLAKLACSVAAGFLTMRFFVIYHDQQHQAILAKSRAAEWLMRGFGILVLSPSSIWRSSHDYHHKHNSKLRSAHIGSFPVMTKAQYALSSQRERLTYLLIRHPLTITFGYLSMFLFGMCLNPFLSQPKKHFDCLIALVIHAAIGVALVSQFGWNALLLTQTIPLLLVLCMGSYVFYAQHNFPGVIFSDHEGWAYEKAALESSCYIKTNPLMAWFTANIGYHHIHHLNHRIPFYRLPEVFRALPELQHPKTTSFSPRDIWRCLRLKVWDAEAQRMVAIGRA